MKTKAKTKKPAKKIALKVHKEEQRKAPMGWDMQVNKGG